MKNERAQGVREEKVKYHYMPEAFHIALTFSSSCIDAFRKTSFPCLKVYHLDKTPSRPYGALFLPLACTPTSVSYL